MKLDITPQAALDALGQHIKRQRAALRDLDDRHIEALRIATAEANILRQVLAEAQAEIEKLRVGRGEPVGYTTLTPEGAGRWRQPEQLGLPTARDEYLCYARDAADGSRAAVVYLLPEGDKA